MVESGHERRSGAPGARGRGRGSHATVSAVTSAQREVRAALRRVAAATPSGVLRSTEETKVLRIMRVLGEVAGELMKAIENVEREPEGIERALSTGRPPQ